MLRVIAGKYRGRKIATGKYLAVRPTMSVVREAIFNILSSKKPIYNLNVLDLFCGSGAFSFEALSRGAKHAFMVDSDYYNLQLPKKTAKDFGTTDNITLICCSANRLPKTISQCDIVFIGPPYNSNLVHSTLDGLINSDWIGDDTLIILEIRKNEDFKCSTNFNIILERTYGIAKIIFLSLST
ncbi:16S rRNA (guanine(966)-N(2))-methyltransferase RsmD [Wolbachia endosymbiont of Dirofilaria (Dirofilaria) immitis]|uniref:16S rRNA (guanine(966)-N(2))-methyltransferase RsmD n=1 Tax=Wolbachia endosymbiont of Dirofilaria (Dirofilaria) immitis TaxID=1812115 RepID=UPI00158AFB36|nr:16S rRNA (guanine(966)-N(2))-methyltransferase RsmD [Wolbachia endosymbiont of Dirofilaria (Dirofilaria) immitis]QKX02068.1 16S rRNA (guanine(966)-N(2))-methyltransferase RsmD [Wolbachia endosymbiont of Dirofilaria (Dirofilaria) immitis]